MTVTVMYEDLDGDRTEKTYENSSLKNLKEYMKEIDSEKITVTCDGETIMFVRTCRMTWEVK